MRARESWFEPHLQGLRAIAVLMVVGTHAGVAGFTGGFVGVDVFFVLSGYVITRKLIREGANGSVNLGAFYAGRARRLLPGAMLVIASIWVASRLGAPWPNSPDLRAQLLAATFYYSNWFSLVTLRDGYFAVDASLNPVLHYWSLAIEEQFYLVWPLLLIGVHRVAAKTATAARSWLLATLLVLTGASLTGCIWLSIAAPEIAYLSTWTRVWQLGAGALVAVLITRSARWTWLNYVGLLGLAGSIVMVTPKSYPGWQAVIPVLATAVLVVTGRYGVVGRVLTTPVMLGIGEISYAWYLWHWPLLVWANQAAVEHRIGYRAFAVAISLALAIATYFGVERPLRTYRIFAGSASRVAWVGAVATVAAALPLFVYQSKISGPESALVVPSSYPVDGKFSVSKLVPSPAQARQNFEPRACLVSLSERQPADCISGELDGKHVALVGDSQAHQWAPALLRIGDKLGWRLMIQTKAACALIPDPPGGRSWDRTPSCTAWSAAMTPRLKAFAPEIIFVANVQQSDQAKVAASWRRWVEQWPNSLVVELISPPVTTIDVPKCLLTATVSACTPKYIDVTSQVDYAAPNKVIAVYTRNLVCTPACSWHRGNTLVYRDIGHLTAFASAQMWVSLYNELVSAGALPADPRMAGVSNPWKKLNR